MPLNITNNRSNCQKFPFESDGKSHKNNVTFFQCKPVFQCAFSNGSIEAYKTDHFNFFSSSNLTG